LTIWEEIQSNLRPIFIDIDLLSISLAFMDNYLYKEEIIDHYKNPQNFGRLQTFDVSSKQHNPFCGDEIELFLVYQKSQGSKSKRTVMNSSKNGIKVSHISFLGHGCAISIASASILTEFVKGKTLSSLTKFSQEDMLKLVNIKVSEIRKKCLLLSWSVLQDCLKQKD
jgi:nitrogen fixation NifU-like protein